MSVVLAAAGTGGHLYPALAVAEALVARGLPRSEVVFFGGDRIEAAAVPAAGFPFAGFDLPRLRRTAAPSNAAIPWVLRRAAREMRIEMERRGSRVVLGTSGYATVPAALAAGAIGTPLYVQEQNSVPGLAARFAARRARTTFLGLPGPAERLPRSRVVGNPLRAAFDDFDRTARRPAARARYGLPPDGQVLGVIGGSQGARSLNQAVAAMMAGGTGAIPAVLHLTGGSGFGEMTGAAAGSPGVWRCLPFEESMPDFYASVDLVVCRAGAMTISELAATATPALLVPLGGGGQKGNAAVLARTGAARVLSPGHLGSLEGVAGSLLSDRESLSLMAAAACRLAFPGAAAVVAEVLLEVVHG